MISNIASVFKDNKFSKKGLVWRKHDKDNTIVIALQKSKHSNRFTFEMGICVDPSRDIATLKYYTCGVSFRLNKIPEFGEIDIDGALNLDSDNKIPFSYMITFLSRDGMNIIERFFDYSYLKTLYDDGFFKDKMIDNVSTLILSD